MSCKTCCVAGLALVLSGVASASESVRTNYYAWGGGTKNSFSYNWFSPDNWRVIDEGTNAVPACIPQQGDIVIFNKSIDYMSASDGKAMPALWKVDFQTPNTIHQGFVNLLAGGEGLTMTGDMNWWAGLQFTGSGEVPIHVPDGKYFDNQKGVYGTATFVKTGGGLFQSASEGASPYQPTVTKLQGGAFYIKSNDALANGEFIFDSNSADLRLVLHNSYTSKGTKSWYNSWTLNNGALSESASVDNTTHGITCSDTEANAYLRLTGTPKTAEQRFTGQLYGTAGISFAPGAKQTGGADYVFTFAKAVSTAGGGLAVTNGTMKLAEGASFSALKVLNVGAGATFEVESGSGQGFVCQALDLQSGGKFKLAADVTLGFGVKAKVAGETLAEGTYTAAGTDGTTAADWIEGDGSVVVDRYAGTYGTNQLVLDIAQGQTVGFAKALADYNTAHETEYTLEDLNGGALKDWTLVKRGLGTLTADVTNKTFQGIVHIEQGLVDLKAQYGLGRWEMDSAPFYVHAGATLSMNYPVGGAANNVSRIGNRIVHIAGTGTADNGALRATGAHLNYGTVALFGKEIVLDDDAKIVHRDWYTLTSTLRLNGFTCTIKGSASGGNATLFTKVADNGHLKFIDSNARYPGMTFDGTDPDNTITFGNNGGFRFWSNGIYGSGARTWTYIFNGATTTLFGDCGVTRDSGNNSFYNRFFITNTVTQTSQGNTEYSSVYVRGKVSGTGKFALTTSNTEAHYLHLMNAENDFSGGVTVGRGVVCAYGGQSLPDSGVAKLSDTLDLTKGSNMTAMPEFYGLSLFGTDLCSLPPLEYDGTKSVMRVQGGRGSWKSIVKKGTGTLAYNSEAGSPLLNVQNGTFKLPRGAAPGLWEGVVTCADAAAAATALAGTATPTNMVMRGPTSAIGNPYLAPSSPSSTKLITYSGYVWNRTGAEKTMTFASSVKGASVVKIDGETVIDAAANARTAANVTLAPGPHAFEYRAVNGNPTDASTAWPKWFGFAYDAQGRNDLATTNNFKVAVDPGDGSLFTRSTSNDALPAFDKIALASGAKLDLNGNVYTAADLAGAGIVTNTATDGSAAAKLVLSGQVTVNAAANDTLKIAVPLELGENFKVSVTNVARRLRGRHTVFTAAVPVTVKPANISVVSDGGDYWTAQLSADGKSLELVKLGLQVFLR